MIKTRIKIFRVLKKISQKRMAELLHKSQSAYCRLENGELQMTADDLLKIAEVLDCKPEDLLNDDAPLITSKYSQHSGASIRNPTEGAELNSPINSKIIQIMLENQNKAIDEMKFFLGNQSEQLITVMKELIQLVKN